MNNITIVPAILEPTLQQVAERLEQVKEVATRVQIDVVDPTFAPKPTWPYTTGGEEQFAKIVAGDEGLPLWEDFDFEIDLMVENAERDALQWVAAGASAVIIHLRSPDSRKALESLQAHRTGEFAVQVGAAIPPTSAASDLATIKDLIDFVQVMGINTIGRQGEPFNEDIYALLRNLHTTYPDLSLHVDGAVKAGNVRELAEAGATTLCVGSAIFGQENPRLAYETLVETVSA